MNETDPHKTQGAFLRVITPGRVRRNLSIRRDRADTSEYEITAPLPLRTIVRNYRAGPVATHRQSGSQASPTLIPSTPANTTGDCVDPDVVSRLADSEARSQLIIESAPDAFIGIDLDSRIVAWNARATAVFGWSREEALGLKLWDTIIPDEHREAHKNGMRRFHFFDEATASNRLVELSARNRGGRVFPVEVTINGPIRSSTGDFFGAFFRDISVRKIREEELRKAKNDAESHAKALEILNGIGRELSALLNADDLLKRIGELLFQLVEYHTLSVFLLDTEHKVLKHRFSLSGSKVVSKPDIPISEGLVGHAARTRQPVVVGDVNADSRYIKFDEETHSELCVPLITNDKVIGVLDIENRSSNYFRVSHVQVITLLASQLAIALDNAMLYDRISAQEHELNQELRFARKLQRSLLVDDLPVMHSADVSTLSWPARIIAGDIFDFGFYRRSGQHVGILGDVSGKGAPAAIYAALTSGIIRLLLDDEPSPSGMLKRVNETLLERPLEAQFVALMFMLWDDEQQTLRIANSGLPCPVHFRNGTMQVLSVVGTPLGLLPGIDYEEIYLKALPQDVFVFLTDGILEATNREGEEFGYKRLESSIRDASTLGVNEIRDAIAGAITSHSDSSERVDDQTLIVLKVLDTAGHPNEQAHGDIRLSTGELTLS